MNRIDTTKSKFILLAGLFGLIILAGLFAKKKHYPVRYNGENSVKQVDNHKDEDVLRTGDLIFQTSLSEQSKAIQLATHSEYSHCGLIYKDYGSYFVFEAVQPVKRTRLEKWISRGKDGHFVIKRLKNADDVLTPEVIQKMKKVGENFNGKNYDTFFGWSDDRMYCSELIWKIYQRATGLEIGKLEKLRDFDLSDNGVKARIQELYGDDIPLDDTVISPSSIFNSGLLITIKTN